MVDEKEIEELRKMVRGFVVVVSGILQNTWRDREYSYKNAQCFPELNPYPLRCNKIQALFGHISSLEFTVPFYSEDMGFEVHREDKQEFIELDVDIFVLLTFCLFPKNKRRARYNEVRCEEQNPPK